MTQAIIVNSWNEWDPLKHVIVGRADGFCVPPNEPAYEFHIPESSELKGKPGARFSEAVDKANKQLDYFVHLLEKRAIQVDRPQPLDFSQAVKTPDWEIDSMMGCMPPRDVLLTIGNEILEATMCQRSRWYEYLSYRPLLQKYFEADANMRWEAAPKPRLTNSSFKTEYFSESISTEKRRHMVTQKDFVLTEIEPLFDAADVCRMGKDLFVQYGLTTNLKGINWLRRHFPNLRTHIVNFPGDLYPSHMDATFVPLKPGLCINNRSRPLPKAQRKIFEINDWEIVESAQPIHKTSPPLCSSSVWLSMNCLIIDQKTVCVEASEVHQIEQFDKLGFEVIPIPFRDVYPFGGGIHCATADVYREGNMQDYFPKQVKVY